MRMQYISANRIPQPDRGAPGAVSGIGWSIAYAAAYQLAMATLWNSPRSPGYITNPPIVPISDAEVEENRQGIIHFTMDAARMINADTFEAMLTGIQAGDRYVKWINAIRQAGDRAIDPNLLATYTYGPAADIVFAEQTSPPAPGSIKTTLEQMDMVMGNTGRSHLDPPKA